MNTQKIQRRERKSDFLVNGRALTLSDDGLAVQKDVHTHKHKNGRTYVLYIQRVILF